MSAQNLAIKQDESTSLIDIISEMLNQPLDRRHVSQRKQGNFNLSYIEGHHAIREANRIFGFSGWSYRVNEFKIMSEETYEKAGYNNGPAVKMYRISVMATVCVDAIGVDRSDVGYGQGSAKTLADAHESAGKEAVTDALKRALRTFGDQFGNALYDKQQLHVVDGAQVEQAEKDAKYKSDLFAAIRSAKDMSYLNSLIQHCATLTESDKGEARKLFASKKAELEGSNE